jgi:hypothetical protein
MCHEFPYTIAPCWGLESGSLVCYKKRLWAPTYLVSTSWTKLGLRFVRYKIKINSSSRVVVKVLYYTLMLIKER